MPALLTGRLATDSHSKVAGQGLGSQMVGHVLALAVEMNHKAAFRAVVVNGLDADACQWWQRLSTPTGRRQLLRSLRQLYRSIAQFSGS
jgi:hypothetical protein